MSSTIIRIAGVTAIVAISLGGAGIPSAAAAGKGTAGQGQVQLTATTGNDSTPGLCRWSLTVTGLRPLREYTVAQFWSNGDGGYGPIIADQNGRYEESWTLEPAYAGDTTVSLYRQTWTELNLDKNRPMAIVQVPNTCTA